MQGTMSLKKDLIFLNYEFQNSVKGQWNTVSKWTIFDRLRYCRVLKKRFASSWCEDIPVMGKLCLLLWSILILAFWQWWYLVTAVGFPPGGSGR